MPETSKTHERYLAGVLLNSLDTNPKGDYNAIEILAKIKHTDLIDNGSKAVFYACEKLFKQGVSADLGAVLAVAKKVGSSPEEVMNIASTHFSTASYEWHLEELSEIIEKKAVFKALKELSLTFGDSTLGDIKNTLGSLLSENTTLKSGASCYEEMKERLFHSNETFIPSGSSGLDFKMGGGFQPGQMITLGARPGMGKTSFALQLVTGRAKMGLPSMIFSMEMNDTDVLARLVAQHSSTMIRDVDNAKKVGYEVLQRCEASADFFNKTNVRIFESSQMTVEWIRIQIKTEIHKAESQGLKKPELIVIDYLGLLTAPRELKARGEELLAHLSREIKKTAMECGVAILILAQLNREVEKREDPTPKLSDLRGSGAIEQDSNKVLFVFRPEMYSEKASDQNIINQDAMVFVRKNREGAVGVAEYTFNPTIGVWNEF
jgi:replicative DNA helicase